MIDAVTVHASTLKPPGACARTATAKQLLRAAAKRGRGDASGCLDAYDLPG
jgi:hypothetical protein